MTFVQDESKQADKGRKNKVPAIGASVVLVEGWIAADSDDEDGPQAMDVVTNVSSQVMQSSSPELVS